MFLLPISTDTSVRRTPWVNYGLIALNVVIFGAELMLGGAHPNRTAFGAWFDLGVLDAGEPYLYQFFTYQFLHGGFMHLAGNMLFLWVFGNPVNGKMGHAPYLLFYLAGGIFAAAGYAWGLDQRMVGASGSIAAVTTAYLALFPRSHITIVYWWFFIGTFELPSMIMIVFKMIIWDNVISMRLMEGSNIAFEAHLAGYAFGLAATAGMLALRLLPRDQFDIVALWRRWLLRRTARPVDQTARVRARPQLSRVARPVSADDVRDEPKRDGLQTRISEIRHGITEAIGLNDRERAAELYCELIDIDPRQFLPRSQQLEVANQLYLARRLPQAAAAYEKYLSHYPQAPDADQVELLLGIIYARDFQQYEMAEAHLRQSLARSSDERRRDQCREWLQVVTEAMRRPSPEA